MEAVILTQTFTGWVPQCYRITSCKLIQFKQRYTSLDSIAQNNASQIQQQYDINNMQVTATLNRSNESILQIDINHIQIFLKFYFEKEFVAWYRILSASKQPINNKKCMERPIPSNISFAIYNILQNLYIKSKNISSINNTTYNNNIKMIKKIHYDLTVNNSIKTISSINNINIIYGSLIYVLKHMPTSLFCYKYQQILGNTIKEIFEERESTQAIPSDSDKYILILDDKNTLNKITKTIINIYNNNKQTYMKTNGFDLFDRFNYLILLFVYLNYLLVQQNMSIKFLNELTDIFAKCLRSKQSDHQSINLNKLEKQQKNFKILIKTLIYYSNEIFPKINGNKMGLSIPYTGNERSCIETYNALVQKKINKRQSILIAEKLESHLQIKDRKYRFKTYKNCFISKEAIPIIINLKLASTDDEAIDFANKLMVNGIIKHVQTVKEFKKGYHFYEFINGYANSKSLPIPSKITNILSNNNLQNNIFNTNLFKHKSKQPIPKKPQESKVNPPEKIEQKSPQKSEPKPPQKQQQKPAEKRDVQAQSDVKEEEEVEEEIKEYAIGEYTLPLKQLFTGVHPGYKTELALQNITRGMISIEIKCTETVDDDDDMYTSYKYVIDLQILKGFNLICTDKNLCSYIMVTIDDMEYETKCVNYNGRNIIEFNEKFEFELDEQPKDIKFNVFNKTISKKDMMKDSGNISEGYKVNVNVLEGYGLDVQYLPVEYNPFVIVKIGKKEFKTRVIMGTNDPKWNDKKEFIIETSDFDEVKEVVFRVYNERKSPQLSQLIGEKEHEMNEKDKGKVMDLVINSKKGAGIKVKLEWEELGK